MNKLAVFGAVVYICFTACAGQDEEALVPTSDDWARARVVLARAKESQILVGEKDAEGRFHEAQAQGRVLEEVGLHTIIDKPVTLWPSGRVPYIISNLFENRTDDKTAILAQIRWFNPDQTCVEWVPRTTEKDFVMFTPNGRQECSAEIGKKDGMQTILLGHPACFVKDGGVVMHEMLHVLGLIHEHARVDRDRWVKVDLDNMNRRWWNQYLKIRPSYDLYKRTPYDYASIMHYGPFDNAVDETRYTIQPLAGGVLKVMGQRQKPSPLDIIKVNTLYGCPCPQYDSVDCTATHPPIPTPTTSPERCILLIGGYRYSGAAPLVEYYHPTAECNIGAISTERVEDTEFTSGCFLPDTQQLVIRETFAFGVPDKPPMLYPLSGEAATTLPLPYLKFTSRSTSAMVGGKCVSCGGWTGYGGEKLSHCFSFSTTHWTSLPPLPQPLYHAASVALGADYYVIGGKNSTYGTSDQVYRYNTISNQWHTETPMDNGRYYHSAAALSDTELIVCGGQGKTSQIRRDCTMYSATTRRWTRAADLNQRRDDFAMVVFGGRVYALGGRGDTVEVYDRAADSWTIVDKKLKGGRIRFVGLVV